MRNKFDHRDEMMYTNSEPLIQLSTSPMVVTSDIYIVFRNMEAFLKIQLVNKYK